jgi:hypothetical protein
MMHIANVLKLPTIILRRTLSAFERVGMGLKRRGYGRSGMGRAFIDAMFYPTDLRKIIEQYRDTFGCRPRLWQPVTFNEHVQSSKLFCRNARHTVFADKLLVREFVRARIGDDVLPRIYWAGTNLSEAQALALPRSFVLKANHGSGFT